VTRILVVEDAEIVASGFRATLEEDRDNHVIGVVASVEEAETAVRSGSPDVLVADVRLSDGTAFDLLARLPDRDGRPVVLIVSTFDLAQYVEAALKMGASGYILKTAPSSELLAAVRAVAAGGWAFDPDLMRRLPQAKQLSLSPRDRQVVAGLLDGQSNDEIGMHLGISRKTVESYISKLFQRFEVMSRVELVRRAEHEQWLATPRSEPPIVDGQDARQRSGKPRSGSLP
jgi:DNA-binding NarL/FixJ family response regulator